MKLVLIATAVMAVAASWTHPRTACAQSSSFEERPMADGGAAVLSNPAAGVYVYRLERQPDRPKSERSVITSRRRTEFTLFSADEEEALWNMREKLLHPPRPEFARLIRAPHVATRGAAAVPSEAWPKVIVMGAKTCVPSLPFAESPAWREHLICWSSEKRRVE